MKAFLQVRRIARPLLVAVVALGGIMATAPYGRATPLDDAPDGVLGQPDFTTGACGTLCGPVDVATDSAGNVYIADGANSRVVEYDNPFLTGNAVADRVFGQSSLGSVGCNNGGVSASSLCGAVAVFIDGGDNLWVSDSGNHRILGYESPLTDRVADIIVGQPTFTAVTYSNSGDAIVYYPQGLYVDASLDVWAVDQYRNRVLEFDDVSLEAMTPDRVYGQPDFVAVQCNGGAAGMCAPWDVNMDTGGSLYISDLGLNRVLVYHSPLVDQTADEVIGQPNFTSYGCNAPTAGAICMPRGIAFDGTSSLYVTDAGHNRVLRFGGGAPFNRIADDVYGQLGSFTGNQSCLPLSATNMCQPRGIEVDAGGNLWVAQSGTTSPGERVLVYGATCATFTDGDCDGYTDVAPVLHAGPSNTNTGLDNCIGVGNPTQANADGNFIDLAPGKSFNDVTWPNSDYAGDVCDADADNDGESNSSEATGLGNACGEVSAPLERDTDGDRFLDGAECDLSFLPNDARDFPSLVNCGGGPNSWSTDADADGIIRAYEHCFYNTDPNNADTDGDGCSDGREIASVNGDKTVNAIDLSQVAQAFGPYALPAPAYKLDFDMNKDKTISAIDLSQVAQRFGAC